MTRGQKIRAEHGAVHGLIGDGGGQAWRVGVVQRNPGHNPHVSLCPIGLRRICGTCAHFGGDDIRGDGDCVRKGGVTAGTSDAARCRSWSRKAAQ